MALLHLRIHTHAVLRFGSLEARLAPDIASTPLFDEPCRRRLLRRLAAMPDGDRLYHEDLHSRNSLGATAQPIVIEWPDAALAIPLRTSAAPGCC